MSAELTIYSEDEDDILATISLSKLQLMAVFKVLGIHSISSVPSLTNPTITNISYTSFTDASLIKIMEYLPKLQE